jgi:glucokinase
VPTLAKRAPELIVKDMADLSAKLIEKNGLKLSDVEYVGIAAPGTINSEEGVVEYSNNIPFHDFPISKIFKQYLPVDRVLVANDANAAALGEALAGAARGTKNSVMITLGTGVGGGVIIDGKIFSGGVNAAGAELGHTVIVAGGRQCTCGRRGCWEAYSSATALVNMTNEKITELKYKGLPTLLTEEAEKSGRVTGRTSFDAMKRGDAHAKQVVDDYIYYLAVGITNMINIFQPEILSIGGGVCNQRENLTTPLIKLVDDEQYTRSNPKRTKIVTAALGNDAGIIGAAGLGR